MKLYRLFSLCLLATPVLAQMPATLIWEGTPLTITLPIAQEKRLIFPEPIRWDATMTQLYAKDLTILNNHGNIYLKAKHPFGKKRILVHLKRSGQVMLLDIQAHPKGTTRPIQLSVVTKDQRSPTNTLSPLSLMRYGIQTLYGDRAPTPIAAIEMLTPLKTKPHWLITGIQSEALLRWQSGPYQLTALALTNLTNHPIKISLPTAVSSAPTARWVSCYPTQTLAPKNHCPDKTTVFILTEGGR